MPKSTILLLLGLLLAACIAVSGYIDKRLDAKALSALVQKCMASDDSAPAQGSNARQYDWEADLDDSIPDDGRDTWPGQMVCDPEDLVGVDDGATRGIQREIIDAAKAQGDWAPNAYVIAAVIAGLFSIPYLWYFLLRRLREVVAVFKGT